jgi:hypothetical protein
VGGGVPVDSETLLVTDFMNLKIKPTQSFEGAHRGRVCVRVFSKKKKKMPSLQKALPPKLADIVLRVRSLLHLLLFPT